MLSFIVQRLFQSIIVMISVAFVSFALFQFVGDPINNMVGQDATEEQRQLLREKLGLDKPWPLQFANFVLNISQGEFGMSYRVGIPVDELIATRLPATIELVLVSAVLSLIVGIPMGIYTCLLYTSPSPRDGLLSRMPSSA